MHKFHIFHIAQQVSHHLRGAKFRMPPYCPCGQRDGLHLSQWRPQHPHLFHYRAGASPPAYPWVHSIEWMPHCTWIVCVQIRCITWTRFICQDHLWHFGNGGCMQGSFEWAEPTPSHPDLPPPSGVFFCIPNIPWSFVNPAQHEPLQRPHKSCALTFMTLSARLRSSTHLGSPLQERLDHGIDL